MESDTCPPVWSNTHRYSPGSSSHEHSAWGLLPRERLPPGGVPQERPTSTRLEGRSALNRQKLSLHPNPLRSTCTRIPLEHCSIQGTGLVTEIPFVPLRHAPARRLGGSLGPEMV
jgi:hypothetical protein